MAATRPPKAVSPIATTRVRPSDLSRAVRASGRGPSRCRPRSPPARRRRAPPRAPPPSASRRLYRSIIRAMARTPLPLPPAPVAHPGRARRAADFLAWTWRGRTLLARLGLVALEWAGVPIPCRLNALARVLLFLYSAWGLFRLGRFLVRRLLWRIRTRSSCRTCSSPWCRSCCCSCSSAGRAPVHWPRRLAHRDRRPPGKAAPLQPAAARPRSPRRPAEMERHLAAARAVHPGVEYGIVRGGASRPRPAPCPPPRPRGCRRTGRRPVRDGRRTSCARWRGRARTSRWWTLPLDARLFADLERGWASEPRSAGTAEKTETGITIKRGRHTLRPPRRRARGMTLRRHRGAAPVDDGEAAATP